MSKPKKKISKGHQAFNVPNDEEGRLFLELAKKFRHKGTKIDARGRHANRKEAWAGDPYDSRNNRSMHVKKAAATHFAVYVRRRCVYPNGFVTYADGHTAMVNRRADHNPAIS